MSHSSGCLVDVEPRATRLLRRPRSATRSGGPRAARRELATKARRRDTARAARPHVESCQFDVFGEWRRGARPHSFQGSRLDGMSGQMATATRAPCGLAPRRPEASPCVAQQAGLAAPRLTAATGTGATGRLAVESVGDRMGGAASSGGARCGPRHRGAAPSPSCEDAIARPARGHSFQLPGFQAARGPSPQATSGHGPGAASAARSAPRWRGALRRTHSHSRRHSRASLRIGRDGATRTGKTARASRQRRQRRTANPGHGPGAASAARSAPRWRGALRRTHSHSRRHSRASHGCARCRNRNPPARGRTGSI
jgi:hypothetical protein